MNERGGVSGGSNAALGAKGRISGRMGPLLASFLLLALVVAGSAFADEDGGESPAAEAQLAAAQIERPSEPDLRLTDPQAAAELPHRDLDREEALELTESVFEPALEAVTGPFQDLSVEKYLSDNAAIVSASPPPDGIATIGGEEDGESSSQAGGEAHLVESTIPLRTEGPNGAKEPVDLDLERVGDQLEPKAPLAEVQIPQELGDGIRFPGSGIGIELANAPSHIAPSLIENSVATYPNVATDTDYSVAPTPTGVETLTTLRSADSPKEQTLDLQLPPGAQLLQAGDGAEVVQDGHPLLRVLPPFAVDANGADVPVKLSVAGDSLTTIASPAPDAAYPILVDPVYEDYDWFANPGLAGQWAWQSQKPASANAMFTNRWANALEVSGNAGWHPANEVVGWTYSVPRLQEEEGLGRVPNSYIADLLIWHVGLSNQGGGGPSAPFLFAGIWGGEGHWAGKPGQPEAVWSLAGNSQETSDNPGYGVDIQNGTWGARDQGAKVAYGLGMATWENVSIPTPRWGYLGAAKVEIGDENRPGIANPNVLPWEDTTAKANVKATAQDSGLGVKALWFAVPGLGSTRVTNSCVGTVLSPCPYQWTGELAGNQANPEKLPQGFNYVSITSEDVVGNTSLTPVNAMIPVDHTSPALSVSGTLTEQAKLGTSAAEYKLAYDVVDGDSQAPAALAPFGSAGSGEGNTQRPSGMVVDSSGNILVTDRDNNRVEKFDPNGKFLMQFGSAGSGNGQLLEPRGIAIGPNGNIWVVDSGNARVQQFTPAGAYVSKFGTKGSGGGTQFQLPYGIAIVNGVPGFNNPLIYVSDQTGNRVAAFLENGSFFYNMTGTQSGGPNAPTDLLAPTGLAVDSDKSLWVADSGHDQIQKYDSNGHFVARVGTPGTGNGQFDEPSYLASAPSGNMLVTDGLNGRVQEFRRDGKFVRAFASRGSGPAQLLEPRGLAVGSGNVAYVADAGNHRIARWNHASFDPQSGAAKTEVKVDGNPVEPAYNPGCATENCAIHREWRLEASKYAAGAHNLQITAWDGVGRATSKTLTVTTKKDTTSPSLSATGSLISAPQGWVEQKPYAYAATAQDPGGYGVTSLVFKVDGKVLKSISQGCPTGGCEAAISGSLDMSTYKGGAHPAEIIATDGAGLVQRRLWTINVTPSGSVAAAEAKDTIEAVETTSPEVAPIASNGEVIDPWEAEDGDNPKVVQEGAELRSTGTAATSAIATAPQNGFSVASTEGTIKVAPTSVGGSSTTAGIVNEVAGMAANTSTAADSVMRPTYAGLTDFSVIRTAAAPESYSWEVILLNNQTLKAVDSGHAAVYATDGTVVMLIAAEHAHGADGKAVATSLAVTGPHTVTVTVKHRVAGTVYPVVSGAEFEVGYSTVIVTSPPPPPPPPAEEGPEPEGVSISLTVSAPEPAPTNQPGEEASASFFGYRAIRRWAGNMCPPDYLPLINECEVWYQHIKGFFYYDFHEAWFPDNRQPVCEHGSDSLHSVEEINCNWVGPNHQKYGGGYHITAQTRVYAGANFIVAEHKAYHAVTLRAFGDGNIYAHETDQICNPSRPGC